MNKKFEYQGKDYSVYYNTESRQVYFTSPTGVTVRIPLHFAIKRGTMDAFFNMLTSGEQAGWRVYGDRKSTYRKFNEVHGMTLSLMLSLTRGWWWNEVVGEETNQRIFKKFCTESYKKSPKFPYGLINFKDVYLWLENKQEILQMVKDGNEKLLWVAFHWGVFDTKLLKERYGNGCWKAICSLSEYSIKDLMNTSSPCELNFIRLPPSQRLKLRAFSQLGYYGTVGQRYLDRVVKDRKVPATLIRRSQISQVVYDVIRMCEEVGLHLPSYKDLFYNHAETHDIVLENFLKRREGIDSDPTPFEALLKFPDRVEKDGMVAIKVGSPFDLTKEGKKMHHCVGGYRGRCKKGDYLVYHIAGEGAEESTLGISVDDGKLTLNQHYGYCNSRVGEATAAFGKYVVEEVSKSLEEERNEKKAA